MTWVGFQRLRAGAWRTVVGIIGASSSLVAWLSRPASRSPVRPSPSPPQPRTVRQLPGNPRRACWSCVPGIWLYRPSASSWLPALGAGPVTDNIFSYGLVGVFLFILFFTAHVPALAGQGCLRFRSWAASCWPPWSAVHYGMNTGLMLSVVAAVASPGRKRTRCVAPYKPVHPRPVPLLVRSAPLRASGRMGSPAAATETFSTGCSNDSTGQVVRKEDTGPSS